MGGLSELIYLRSLEQCMEHSKGCVRACCSFINSSILNLEPRMAMKYFKRVGSFPDVLEHVCCCLSWESGGGVPPIAVLMSYNSREIEMDHRRAKKGGFICFCGAFREQGFRKAFALDLPSSLCPLSPPLPLPQGPRARCDDPCGRSATPGERRAGALPNAAHRQPDRLGHGVSGLAALRAPGPGHQELPGRSQPAGEDRRLRHVQGCLQH